jgi:hypothetical protein
MRKNILFIGLCILFVGFAALDTGAQETPTAPENFVVFEEFVSTADMATFREVQAKTVKYWKKHELGVPVYCYLNDDNAYYWVVPIENFAAIDVLFEKVGALTKKMEEDGFDGQQAFRDLSNTRTSVIHWEKDLSYHPDGKYGQRKDNGYVEWAFLYMKQGHEKEATEVVKKYIDFYNSIPESSEWDLYSVVFGHDTPCWILMNRATSEMALRAHEKDLNEKYGDKFKELWADFALHVRKIENKKGWFQPDWSINWQTEQ